MRDKLWVEDVMWALRVRKTRREIDKWEVNEHREKWISILEAATPENPTVFATSPDHRIAPPLSYMELLQDSASVRSSSSSPLTVGWALSAASGGSNTSVSTSLRGSRSDLCDSSSVQRRNGPRGAGGRFGGCSGKGDGRSRGGEGSARPTARRPTTTGKMWKPLESRLPTSLLLASRPVSAEAAARGIVGDLTASTDEGIATLVEGSVWEGEGGVGDSTVWCFPS
ncbi:unnamed protein product, partial [Hapterophycus canaliculatus]